MDLDKNMSILQVESARINKPADDLEFPDRFGEKVGQATTNLLRLENGAEALFVKPGGLDSAKRYPMVVLLHGGPFSGSYWSMYSKAKSMLLMQDFCLLIVSYRGTLGYGENLMNTLLGTIGVNDVEDCGELTLKAIEEFKDTVDPKRVGVEGGSHGGFLSGWLIGHPKYKDIWGAACLWNPVLNMTYMVTITDIPDWIFACTKKTEIDFANGLTAEDIALFY
jgi:acylaminoacyl-peptidase